jgi:hypothetical protein
VPRISPGRSPWLGDGCNSRLSACRAIEGPTRVGTANSRGGKAIVQGGETGQSHPGVSSKLNLALRPRGPAPFAELNVGLVAHTVSWFAGSERPLSLQSGRLGAAVHFRLAADIHIRLVGVTAAGQPSRSALLRYRAPAHTRPTLIEMNPSGL